MLWITLTGLKNYKYWDFFYRNMGLFTINMINGKIFLLRTLMPSKSTLPISRSILSVYSKQSYFPWTAAACCSLLLRWLPWSRLAPTRSWPSFLPSTFPRTRRMHTSVRYRWPQMLKYYRIYTETVGILKYLLHRIDRRGTNYEQKGVIIFKLYHFQHDRHVYSHMCIPSIRPFLVWSATVVTILVAAFFLEWVS